MTIFYNLITALFISAPPPLPVIPAFQQDEDWGWFVDIDEKYTPSWHKYTACSWKDFK